MGGSLAKATCALAVETEVDGRAAVLVRSDAGAGQVFTRNQDPLLDQIGGDPVFAHQQFGVRRHATRHGVLKTGR
jgi:hypothetical protein